MGEQQKRLLRVLPAGGTPRRRWWTVHDLLRHRRRAAKDLLRHRRGTVNDLLRHCRRPLRSVRWSPTPAAHVHGSSSSSLLLQGRRCRHLRRRELNAVLLLLLLLELRWRHLLKSGLLLLLLLDILRRVRHPLLLRRESPGRQRTWRGRTTEALLPVKPTGGLRSIPRLLRRRRHPSAARETTTAARLTGGALSSAPPPTAAAPSAGPPSSTRTVVPRDMLVLATVRTSPPPTATAGTLAPPASLPGSSSFASAPPVGGSVGRVSLGLLLAAHLLCFGDDGVDLVRENALHGQIVTLLGLLGFRERQSFLFGERVRGEKYDTELGPVLHF